LALLGGWAIQASAAVSHAGGTISQPGYATGAWFPVTVPTTVLAGLVANGLYPDLYDGTNLALVDASPFGGSWWYRTEFVLPESLGGRSVFLNLERINYRANVWLDGHLVATAGSVFGTYRTHGFDVTQWVRPGAANALAVEIFPPDLASDLALTWVDWNPPAPDANMGILGGVYFSQSGPVTIRSPQVTAALDLASLATAALTVSAEVVNGTQGIISASVAGAIDQVEFAQDVVLAPGETRTVVFRPEEFPQLVLQNPRVWWPTQMGSPELYRATLTAAVSGQTSAQASVSFGIRTVTSELTADGYRLFRVNGKPILIRGAGWSPDLLLRSDPARLEAEIAYVKHLGLNAIRLEGHLESDRFFDLCDQQGILVIPGWQCCDAWQGWDQWGASQWAAAEGSMRDQANRLRNHPSVIDFLIGSDMAPPPDVEQMFVSALQQSNWPNPISASASDTTTPILGESGLKMTGPYQWIPPSYWYLDTGGGGAFGFNTETGPGTAIPTLESLRQMLAPDELDALWHEGSTPQFHAGASPDYGDPSIFDEALSARYGGPASLEDYVLKAQLMNYEAERALFEAFGRNKYAPATGVIHWKLNAAWPSLIWNLYGYDLVPAGSYFGAKKGNEPVHVQYSYDDRSVVVVNNLGRGFKGLRATAAVYDLDGTVRFSAEASVDAPEDSSQRVIQVPDLAGLSPTYFVKLSLADPSGKMLSDNFYWLSTSPETIDWASERWYAPPALTFADFTALAELSPAQVAVSATTSMGAERGETQVVLTNTSAAIAFFVQLELTRGPGGSAVAPVLWDDNDVALMPGESRSIGVSYRVADLLDTTPAVQVSGWNVAPALVGPLAATP